MKKDTAKEADPLEVTAPVVAIELPSECAGFVMAMRYSLPIQARSFLPVASPPQPNKSWAIVELLAELLKGGDLARPLASSGGAS
jgi:hypothetical protein